MRRFCVIALILVLIATGAWFFTRDPLNARAWQPEQSRLATVGDEGGRLQFAAVRDWTYTGSDVVSREWTTMDIDSATLKRTWLFIDYFSSVHGIAHPFISFEFSDGRTLVLSVEARRETDEAYSPIRGAFRQYELMYVWSTERDMIVRRVVHAGHPVTMLPLMLSPEESAALLRLLAVDTNALASEPRFYNTVTGNCMNLLARLINTLSPNRLPYNVAWNLPGYANRYLAEEGLIAPASLPGLDLSTYRSQIEALATSTPEVFAASLREHYESSR